MNETTDVPRKLWTEKQRDDWDHWALILAHEHELDAILADEDQPHVERDNLIELEPNFILNMAVELPDVAEVPKWAFEYLFEKPRIYQPEKAFDEEELKLNEGKSEADRSFIEVQVIFRIKASEIIANYEGPCHVVFPPYGPDIDPNADTSRD